MSDDTKERGDDNSIGENSTEIAATWNENQEVFLKSTSERANCMRWLHNQCNLHFDNLNFYFTIPNVVISTLNGSFTMSLNSLFPDPGAQKYATTIIGLISILSAILITMNQYVKSQQMMEAHRAAGLSYGKLHRTICNELAVRRDQRSNAIEFLKIVKAEQDRLESTSPNILPSIIRKFNKQFNDRAIEKPEIAGDLDETVINRDMSSKRKDEGRLSPSVKNRVSASLRKISSFTSFLKTKKVAPEGIPEENETSVLNMMLDTTEPAKKKGPPFTLSIQKP
jgi:hypothetical protein